VQMLNILSGYDLQVDGHNSAAYLHKLIEAMPASKSSDISPGAKLPYESVNTTHYSVIDKEGNAVSVTYTLNFSFGSGYSVDGAGFLLNNEMDDFSAKMAMV